MKMLFIKMWFFLFISLSAFAESDHFDGKKFFNPGYPDKGSFLSVLKWKIFDTPKVWPSEVINKEYPAPVLPEGKKASFTFINHATFLIQLPGLNILTDPVFSERVSPFKFMGPKRVRPPGISFENLPTIDVVLISHNHYDHMDIDSLKQIDSKFHPLFIVPLKNRDFLVKKGLQNVVELDWWESHKVKDINFHFTPSLHWSSRSLWDRLETLWGSFMVIAPDFKFYFGGDTGYAEHFRDIKTRLGNPDVALLPIGAYEPRWFMKLYHMNPEEAVIAHRDLGSLHSLGMHFGTFQLTDEGINEPVEHLNKALSDGDRSFTVLDLGETSVF